MAYNITHGLLPYFHNQVEQLVSSGKYVGGFNQKQSGSKVHFYIFFYLMPLQVSMNGPSVNWKFFDALKMMTLRKYLR